MVVKRRCYASVNRIGRTFGNTRSIYPPQIRADEVSKMRPKSFLRSLLALARSLPRIGAEQAGSVAVLFAVATPIVIGGIGMGGEVGLWYLKQRQIQHAADLAAYSVASRLARHEGQSTLNAIALNAAQLSGFDQTRGTITVNTPPTSGPNSGATNMVEVLLTQSVDRYFSAIFSRSAVQVSGRAVAKSSGLTVCALALSPTAASALATKASSASSFDCLAASNSTSNTSFSTAGSSSFSATCVYSSGGYATNGSSGFSLTLCPSVVQNADPTPDPYSDVAVPTAPTPCISGNIGSNNVNTTVTPTLTLADGTKYIHYCSLSPSGNVTLGSGVYIVDGNMSTNGQSLTGSGVTFVVGGSVNLTGSLSMDLRAPTTGTYSGLLFFGGRGATIQNNKISGSTGSTLQGAVYFPSGNLEYTGSSLTTNGCTQVIAYTILFSGNSTLRSSCSAAGTRDFTIGKSIALAE
jgi:Flp pilus assembly protein TadG